MKKILMLFVALAAMFSFMSCEDEGILEVSIEDNNADSQWNYDLEEKTLTYSKPKQTMDKTTTTIAGTNTSVVTEEIVLSVSAYTIAFGEMSDDVGTFTMTYTETATAAADTAYASTATVAYDNDFDNTGFSGIVFYSSTITGTYEYVEMEDETTEMVLTFNTGVSVTDKAYTSVPTTDTTYASAGSATSTEYSSSMDVLKSTDIDVYDSETGVEKISLPASLFVRMDGVSFISPVAWTVSE